MNNKSKTTNNKTVKKKSNSKSLKNDLIETKDKYLRLYSEFENYRRRTSKEKVEMINSANKELISRGSFVEGDTSNFNTGAFGYVNAAASDGFVLKK